MPIHTKTLPDCPNCGQPGRKLYKDLSDRLYGVDGSWDLLQCHQCDLIWLSPQTIKEDTFLLYQNYHTHGDFVQKNLDHGFVNQIYKYILNHDYGYSIDYSKNPIIHLIAKQKFFRDELGKKIMFLHHIPAAKLLDVGAGNGKYLSFMKNLGWDVSGIEPDRDAALVAERTLGVPMYTEDFDSINLENEAYHAITMDHVIEHLESPSDALKKAWRLLKSNGVVVILTPNIRSFGHEYFQSAWLHLDPPRHFYLFSPKSLTEVVEKAGFEIVENRTISTSAWWVFISSDVIRKEGAISGGSLRSTDLSLINKFKGSTFLVQENLQQYLDRSKKLGVGEELLIIGKKPSP